MAWNALDSAQTIHAFDLQSVQASPELLGSLASRLINPSVSIDNGVTERRRLTLDPLEGKEFFKASEPGTIGCLEFVAESRAALADLWIEAYWDGDPLASIASPLSMLAGTSDRCENTTSLPCSVGGSRVTFRWPMPMGAESRLRCINKGTRSHAIEISLAVSPVLKEKPLSPMRFHANYNRRDSLSLTARNIVTLADIWGAGRIVGCSLRIDSHSREWWGEGDEKIWLDQHDTPAWQGTGTEDYFGFAWCSDQTFDHPFRGQTRADGSRTGRRIAAMHRYHLLDRLPFHRFALFEMEAWGQSEGVMDYETTVMWYAIPSVSLLD